MRVTTDDIAHAFADVFASILTGADDSWVRREAGTLAGVSGIPLAPFNGVWAEDTRVAPADVERLLEEVAASGYPYSMQMRPGVDPEIASVATVRGMNREDAIPLMVLQEPAETLEAQEVLGLELRVLPSTEAAAHIDIVAEVFGIPREIFARFATPIVQRPDVTCYVGVVDGQPVTTGLGVLAADLVGIFSIATLGAHRGRGYGAAVTTRVAADGFARGARAAWLQASPMGFPVYERLGFTTPERWDCWHSAK